MSYATDVPGRFVRPEWERLPFWKLYLDEPHARGGSQGHFHRRCWPRWLFDEDEKRDGYFSRISGYKESVQIIQEPKDG